MHKNGTRNGATRYRCPNCRFNTARRVDTTVRQLKTFLDYLGGKTTQSDLPGAGRTFRRKSEKFWKIWPVSPTVDEVFNYIFIDGIYLGHQNRIGKRKSENAVLLIVSTIIDSKATVLTWHLARRECTASYEDLLSRIAPPKMVITDGGSGFARAKRKCWPQTHHQRCLFHVYNNVATKTTQTPKLDARKALLRIAKALPKVKTIAQAKTWLQTYQLWKTYYKAFLAEKTLGEYGSIRLHPQTPSTSQKHSRYLDQKTAPLHLPCTRSKGNFAPTKHK
nr:transposase [Boudabousia tangfeifanii]